MVFSGAFPEMYEKSAEKFGKSAVGRQIALGLPRREVQSDSGGRHKAVRGCHGLPCPHDCQLKEDCQLQENRKLAELSFDRGWGDVLKIFPGFGIRLALGRGSRAMLCFIIGDCSFQRRWSPTMVIWV